MARLDDERLIEAFTPQPRFEPPGRRELAEEVVIVLSLSLLYSAVLAVINLLQAPVAGVTTIVYPQVDLATEITDIVFGLAPVALVVYLMRRGREGLASIGLGTARIAQDVGWGAVAGLGVAAVGLSIYFGAVALKINRFVVPVPPLGHWWTVPVLLLGSAQFALLEEVLVVGYLIHRLEQLGWKGLAPVAASAALRGTYHLYQGWGGFTGNLLLGLAFGFAFRRWRRTWPLVVAHFMVDSLAGIGYIVYRGHCFFGTCLR